MNYIFNVSIKDPFEHFARGFHKVCGGHALVKFCVTSLLLTCENDRCSAILWNLFDIIYGKIIA